MDQIFAEKQVVDLGVHPSPNWQTVFQALDKICSMWSSIIYINIRKAMFNLLADSSSGDASFLWICQTSSRERLPSKS